MKDENEKITEEFKKVQERLDNFTTRNIVSALEIKDKDKKEAEKIVKKLLDFHNTFLMINLAKQTFSKKEEGKK